MESIIVLGLAKYSSVWTILVSPVSCILLMRFMEITQTGEYQDSFERSPVWVSPVIIYKRENSDWEYRQV